ncbi:MAG: amidohydrolase family protein [Acidimicrobiales bacterium]
MQRRTQASDECSDPTIASLPTARCRRKITLDAAWQIFGDDRGTLEPGKLADFAVMSANPWTADPDGWADITVSQTRLGGAVAWEG